MNPRWPAAAVERARGATRAFGNHRLMAVSAAVCASIAGGVWLGQPRNASAHPESSPALVNRYITLALHGERIEVSVALLYGQVPGAELRRSCDRDGSGRLDAAEVAALTQRLHGDAAGWLKVQVDAKPVPFRPVVRVDLGGDFGTGGAPVVVEARAPVPASANADVRVALEPGPPLPRQGETEVTLALGEGWVLRASQAGTAPEGSHRTFKTEGSETAQWAARFDLSQRTDVKRQKWLSWMLAPLAVVVASVLAWAARRRQRSGIG